MDTKRASYNSFSFHSATNPFSAKQQTVHGTHKMYEVHFDIVRSTDFSEENNMHTLQH